MNDVLVFLLVASIFVAVTITAVVLIARRSRRLERERTHALRSLASLLGWKFLEEVPMSYFPHLDRFALFGEGHSKQIKNLIYSETNGVRSALFDYTYVVGHGKHRHTHHQSVIYFESRGLSMPFFSLRPEGFLHRIISALGYQDIDFSNRPDFSSHYLLRGADEPAIRNTFNDALLAFYETNPGTCTDGGGNQLFVFRADYRTPPEEARSFMDTGKRLQSMLPRKP